MQPNDPNKFTEKAWSVIEAMMPMLQSAGLSMEDWADILEYSPLPASFVEKVRTKAEQQNQQPDPMQQRMQVAQVAKLESEALENQAEAQLDMARAQEVAQETQIQGLMPLANTP